VDSVGGLVTGLELAEVCDQLFAQRRGLFLPDNSPGRPSELLPSVRSRRTPPLPYCRARLRTDGYALHVSEAAFVGGIRLSAFGKIRSVEIVFACDAHKRE
jgi:hypothetical protein